ncbi:MAG: UDP-N-acetylenolpyruvoylglucosamine reductase [Anaerolineales bacterium]|jgi:UDP-N-acetylmuramate dehydrogenase|nr:UDP-N-acetylmuramate dehydrogenase [Anaerolineae bacterium]MBL8107334.1 UDP-N-acetylmuramate dehydrogenase [Anaerolineales bacterium]MBV6400959.1 UDP-N-acetylenolpyruvoylglucosamine reductase [Anaerolineales bacterium]MCC7189479.1 UDP-N-acetylmuramate dehydrogenase [Anaerolineales bacterium]
MVALARPVDLLIAKFGEMVKENAPLAPFTSARIGGPADLFVTVDSVAALARVVKFLWKNELPFIVIGGGSNILVSDKGVRGVVVMNRAKKVTFHPGDQPSVTAESGVVFSNLANRCASKGLGGIEWAAAVPGTIGGAVYGNAGAFGGDVAGSLLSTELLTENGRERFSVEQMGYGYRASVLKRGELKAIVLSAELSLANSTKEDATVKIQQFSAHRKTTQPPGASMGSMFKNPPGDYAGRLIEASGLKGTRVGNAEISPVHGNFFVNHGATRAEDIRKLVQLAQKTVKEKQGIDLELEIEMVGEW